MSDRSVAVDRLIGARTRRGLFVVLSITWIADARTAAQPARPDPETQKQALLAAMERVPLDQGLGRDLWIEFRTEAGRTIVEVFRQQSRKSKGRPMRLVVEPSGAVEAGQVGWASRVSPKCEAQHARTAGALGFRALLPHLKPDGMFRLAFSRNKLFRKGPGEYLLILFNDPGPYHHVLPEPVVVEIRPDFAHRIVPALEWMRVTAPEPF